MQRVNIPTIKTNGVFLFARVCLVTALLTPFTPFSILFYRFFLQDSLHFATHVAPGFRTVQMIVFSRIISFPVAGTVGEMAVGNGEVAKTWEDRGKTGLVDMRSCRELAFPWLVPDRANIYPRF